MATPHAVIFDFNGTLSDDEPILYSIYRRLFAEHGRPLSEADYYTQLAGRSEEAIIRGWLDVEGDELGELIRERIERYCALVSDGRTVPKGIRAAVEYAAVRVPIAIVSGAFRPEIDAVLDGAGIASIFAAVVTADDVEDGKPEPDGYLRALELLGGGPGPHEVVAFEDTEAGVAAAKAAGLRCLAVLGTMPAERLARADEVVDSIDVPLMSRLLD